MKLYFFYPSRVIGGVEVLFVRLADRLSAEGFLVTVLDYEDGIYSSFQFRSSIQLVSVSSKKKVSIDKDSILISPMSDLERFEKYLSINSEAFILFWFLQPYNLVQFLPRVFTKSQKKNRSLLKFINKIVFFRYHGNVRELLLEVYHKNALLFMDSNVKEFNEYFYDIVFEKPVFIRIPVEIDRVKKRKDVDQLDLIKFVWVGRLKEDVISIFRYVVNDIHGIHNTLGLQVELFVVGSGTADNELRTFLESKSALKWHMIGTLDPRELEKFLLENADCLLAFGTSALEGGKLGIPVILLDPDYKEISENTYFYKWLFMSKDYKLGSQVGLYKNRLPEENTLTFLELIQELQNHYNAVGEKTFSYVNLNHNINQTLADFIDAIDNASLKFGEVKGRLNSSLLRRIINIIKKFL